MPAISVFYRVVIAVSASLLTITAPAHASPHVAVTAVVDHPALDSVREGIRAELASQGFEAGRNLRFSYQSAQGSSGTAAQIARRFSGEHPDVIVAISTPSAQAVIAATRDIPVVYSAVTDPVAARLMDGQAARSRNVTGVSDASPVGPQLDLIRELVPHASRLGVIYSPGEANSVSIVERLRMTAPAAGFRLVEAPAARSVDVAGAAQILSTKVDVMFAPTDNNVTLAFEGIVKAAEQARIPLVSGDTSTVARGATVALGVNYHAIGRQTGKLVSRILRGEAVSGIEPQTADQIELVVSPSAAARQGVHLPPGLLSRATAVAR